jgi:hypothetical protein
MSEEDIVATMNAEAAEAIAIMRPHYPTDSECELRRRAEGWRERRYRIGRWPTDAEIREYVTTGRWPNDE